ncbi:uncharacterized protein LOC112467144 [Temnothorax curvispinosus]|uniref:Uncharacterized protein LOC112467144 n=1 Tax=Temnothorax curvispinosus TaxID=300111 RepID=A0A6J1RAX8_9HYME|nr:uncharacterized protein LOC112467144 [Temnothorax curvispinosus]
MMKNLSIVTKNFLEDNPNLLLTRADKGNVTVALDRDKYITKMEELLGDKETYKVVTKDPTRKLTTRARELLTRWKKSDFISESLYRFLYCSDGTLPRAYGLPKIHKKNCPFRIIVSSIDSPLYNLASFLHKIMYSSFPKGKSHIANSVELVKKLSNVHIMEDHTLVSLDVVSLFTNVPIERVIDSISSRWKYIADNCKIPESEFLLAVRMVLESTFFMFNGVIYQQTFGSPMGSPLSPIGADIVMQDLEERALELLSFTPPFYERYVDDIAMAIPSTECTHTLEVFNSFHPRLQFTMEVGVDGRLNFLEITMIRTENRLQFDWFHKSTFSGRYLNFLSQHPHCQKKGTVICLIDRVFKLSHPKFHEKNLKLVIHILLQNCYPLEFIFKVMQERLKFLFSNSGNTDDENSIDRVPYFTIPYVPQLTEKYKNLTKDLNVKLSYFSLNKLNRYIRVHKDTLPSTSHRKVVYKIDCGDCEASYVGQTGRQLLTRIKEHDSHIRRNCTGHSVITDHRLEHKHEFKWNDVKILDQEPSLSKRLISEMIYIKRQKDGLNLQTDTENLPETYVNVIEGLAKI